MARRSRAPAELAREVKRIAAMDLAALRACWRAGQGCDAPKQLSARLLRVALAFKVQAESCGGETTAQRRAWARIEAARARGAGPAEALRDAPAPSVPEGTRLIRDWGGQTHEVIVHADHVAWRDRRYRSLSAVARAITGTNRNGPAFFGLRERGGGQ